MIKKTSVILRREDNNLLERLKVLAAEKYPGITTSNSDIFRLALWSLKSEWGVK